MDQLLNCSLLPMTTMCQETPEHTERSNYMMEGGLLAGGLQQLLIKEAKQKQLDKTQNRSSYQRMKRNNTSQQTTFHDLPDSLQLEILSYLPASDLCRSCLVCQHWNMLTSDELLWKWRFEKDVNAWKVLGKNTNPLLYKNSEDDLEHKDIYLRCSPEVQNALKHQNSTFHQISDFLRALMPRKTPLLAMFGPGMESNTSGIVRNIIHGESGKFKANGMFPGRYEGAGSGFTLQMEDGLTFNLTTLYSSTKKQREQAAGKDRMKINRMLHSSDKDGEPTYELRSSIKQLCNIVDGFIFVSDATMEKSEVSESGQELSLMLNEVTERPTVPFLILNCLPSENQPTTSKKLSCFDVIHSLQLSDLEHPWQIHECHVDTLEGSTEGFHWIVAQTQRT